MNITFKDCDGKGLRFAAALTAAGHDLSGGDVLLIDADVPLPGYSELCDRHPKVVLYPHGAGAFDVSGDGQWPIHPNTIGRFVIGTGQAEVQAITGYPRQVEVCGWHLCDLRPFRPTTPRSVLFAPTHPMSDGWMGPGTLEANRRVFDLLCHLPYRTKVRHVAAGHPLDTIGLTVRPNVDYEEVPFTVQHGLTAVDTADVVVAGVGTFPNLAVARGCPTIMFGHYAPDDHQNGDPTPRPARIWPLYRDLVHYPLDADQAEDPADLDELIRRACTTDHDIADWRGRFIGARLDPKDFVARFEAMVA